MANVCGVSFLFNRKNGRNTMPWYDLMPLSSHFVVRFRESVAVSVLENETANERYIEQLILKYGKSLTNAQQQHMRFKCGSAPINTWHWRQFITFDKTSWWMCFTCRAILYFSLHFHYSLSCHDSSTQWRYSSTCFGPLKLLRLKSLRSKQLHTQNLIYI